MSINLLDSVKGMFDNDLISKASNLLGENENSVRRAVSGVVPSVLAGIIKKAATGDANSILSMAKNASESGILSNVGNFSDNNFLTKGAEMLKGIFGDRLSDVANTVAGFAGIKPTSAASILSIAAPAALNTIGKHAEATNMNAAGLLSFLNSQKDSILNNLPSGLNLASALGISSLSNIGRKLSGTFLSSVTGTVTDTLAPAIQSAQRTNGKRWAVGLLIALGIAALLWLLIRPKGKNDQLAAPINVNTNSTDATIIPSVHRDPVQVKLPNGVELKAYKGGIEDQLVGFLTDQSRQVDKNRWFDFDNLNFETGSSTITQESMMQVQNIAEILKAFPNAAIKIGGYTDRTGDSVSNLSLSHARAEAVITSLKNNGANESQLAGAEGYGSQFAKAAVDAPDEEKKKDRRIAVSVREKIITVH